MNVNQECIHLLGLYKSDLSDNQYSHLLISIKNGDFIDKVHLLSHLDNNYGLNPAKARANWQII